MGCLSRVRVLLGAPLGIPLLPVNMLVGGGFFVFVYWVVSGRFGWFSVVYVVELHGRFAAAARQLGPANGSTLHPIVQHPIPARWHGRHALGRYEYAPALSLSPT